MSLVVGRRARRSIARSFASVATCVLLAAVSIETTPPVLAAQAQSGAQGAAGSGSAKNPKPVAQAVPVAPISSSSTGAGATIPATGGVSARPSFAGTKPPTTQTEIPGLRTENTRTFENPDGSYTLQGYSSPINYQDSTGAWQAIDTTLVPVSTGSYTGRPRPIDSVFFSTIATRRAPLRS